MQLFHRAKTIPIFLGLVILITSFMGADWSVWVEGCIGIIILLFVFFSRDTSTLGVTWRDPQRWFVLFLGALAISSIWSTNVYATLRGVTYIFIGYAVFKSSRTLLEKHVTVLMVWTHCIISAGAAWGLVSQVFNHINRAEGFLGNANALGAYLALGLTIGIGVSLRSYGWYRILSWVGVAIVGLALARTFSVTAFFGMLVSGIGMLLVTGTWRMRYFAHWKHRLALVLVTVCVGLCCIVVLRTVETKSFREGVRLDKVITRQHFVTSFQQRWRFVEATSAMITDKPLSGFGLGAYQNTFPRYASTTYELPRYAHNHYFELAAEAGIFAAILFVFLVFRVCVRAYRKVPTGTARLPRLLLVWGLTGSAASALVDFGWHFTAVWVLWWFIAGTLQPTMSSQHKRSVIERLVFGVIMLVSVAMLVRGVGVVAAYTAFQHAEAKLGNGQFQEAIVDYKYGLRYDPNPYYDGRLAVALWAGARRDAVQLVDAQKSVTRILRWNPYDHFAYQLQGRIAFSAKDYQLADSAFSKAVELDNGFHLDITVEYANFLLAQHRYIDALRVTSEALSTVSPEAWSANPSYAADLERVRSFGEKARKLMGESIE